MTTTIARPSGSALDATARALAPILRAMPLATPSAPVPHPVGGMLLALLGAAVLSVSDVSIKALSGAYPLHEVVLIRALIGTAGVAGSLLLAYGPRGAWDAMRPRSLRLHGLRAACILVSNLTYFLGLAALPLADGVAIFYVAPLLITALSVPLLGDRVGPHRWGAVAVGLAGVVVMMRPGMGAVQVPALLVIVAALAYALANILARRLGPTDPLPSMAFTVQCAFIGVSLLMGLTVGDGRLADTANPSLAFLLRPWTPPPVADWPVFLAAGLSTTLGGLLLAQAYRQTPPSLVAPFEYSGMPMAVLWGVLVFGTWPDALAWAGIALICGAGLYALHRESRRRAP